MRAPNSGSTGTLVASAQPVQLADGMRLAAATLSWNCSGTDAIEVHVGEPDGPLFCRGGASGRETTGTWVHDGMLFFLQDVSGGKPASPSHTLATVAVSPDVRWRDVALKDAISTIVQQHLASVVTAVRLVPTHHDSVVCEVECGHRSIYFKSFLSERDDTIAVESWAYGRVRRLGVPVPDVLFLDTNRTPLPFAYALLAAVRGTPLRDHGSGMTSGVPALLRQAGRYLRQIHGVEVEGYGALESSTYVRDGVIRGKYVTWTDAVSQKFTGGLQRLEDIRGLDDAALSAIRAAFEGHKEVLATSGPCNRLLHGDFDSTQVFVDPGCATIAGFLDFDDVASGDPGWDLASLAHRDGNETLQTLLEGYEPDEDLARRLPVVFPLYNLIHDIVDARVFHQRGWREQADRAVARLTQRKQRTR